jgi:hypothetical protein
MYGSRVCLNLRAGAPSTDAFGEDGAWVAGLTLLERTQTYVANEVKRDVFSNSTVVQRSRDVEDELEVAVADVSEITNVHARVVRKRGRLPSAMVRPWCSDLSGQIRP